MRPLEISFLTRSGCVQSSAALRGLKAALTELGIGADVPVVDLGDLPGEDVRTGYGTPTILVDGIDLFGLETPRPSSPT